MTLRLLAIVTICAMTSKTCGGEAPEKAVFRVGAYAIDITPLELPVIVNGGMTERTADKVHDRLHARCLVLDDGSIQIALAVVDSCMMPRLLLDEAKQMAQAATGIPTERMLISATHTHSAPAAMGCLGSDRDEPYAAFLPAQIAKGIQMAQARLAPARIGWAVGKDPNNVFCRQWLMKPGTAATNPFGGTTDDRVQMNPGHNNPNKIRPTGPVDDDVSLFAAQTLDGKLLCILGNYSTHYAGAPALSADYFGAFGDAFAKLVGEANLADGYLGIMSNGTSGNANCIDYSRPEPRKFDYLSVARDTAQAAFDVYPTIQWCSWAPICMSEGLLELNIRMPDAEEVAKAQELLAQMKTPKPTTVPEVYARETVLLSQSPPTRELKLQAIRIGPLGITAIPNEVYSDTGLAIKRESPLQPTFTIELANGAEGYLPPPDQHALGGYTTWRARTSLLEVEAEPKIRAKVLELLNQVARQRADEAPVKAP